MAARRRTGRLMAMLSGQRDCGHANQIEKVQLTDDAVRCNSAGELVPLLVRGGFPRRSQHLAAFLKDLVRLQYSRDERCVRHREAHEEERLLRIDCGVELRKAAPASMLDVGVLPAQVDCGGEHG